MQTEQLARDRWGHKPGCKHYGEPTPLADPHGTHADAFCDCHTHSEPEILANGTDIAWPAGWTEMQASEWRRKNGLARPSEPGGGP